LHIKKKERRFDVQIEAAIQQSNNCGLKVIAQKYFLPGKNKIEMGALCTLQIQKPELMLQI